MEKCIEREERIQQARNKMSEPVWWLLYEARANAAHWNNDSDYSSTNTRDFIDKADLALGLISNRSKKDDSFAEDATHTAATYRMVSEDNKGRSVEPYFAMKINDSLWYPVQQVLNIMMKRTERSFDYPGDCEEKLV